MLYLVYRVYRYRHVYGISSLFKYFTLTAFFDDDKKGTWQNQIVVCCLLTVKVLSWEFRWINEKSLFLTDSWPSDHLYLKYGKLSDIPFNLPLEGDHVSRSKLRRKSRCKTHATKNLSATPSGLGIGQTGGETYQLE